MADQSNSKKRSNGSRSTKKSASKKRSDAKGAVDLLSGLAAISRSRFSMPAPSKPIANAPADDQPEEK